MTERERKTIACPLINHSYQDGLSDTHNTLWGLKGAFWK